MVISVVYSPDGNYVVSGSTDKTIRMGVVGPCTWEKVPSIHLTACTRPGQTCTCSLIDAPKRKPLPGTVPYQSCDIELGRVISLVQDSVLTRGSVNDSVFEPLCEQYCWHVDFSQISKVKIVS